MPRWVLLVCILAVASLAPGTVGAPLVPDALNGSGIATTFQVFGHGYAIEGGAFGWNDACIRCEIRLTLAQGQLLLVDGNDPNAIARPLDPGQYELREYRGAFLFTQQAPRNFFVELHGVGKVAKIG